MKYRYALTHEVDGHATVLGTPFRWDWMAMLALRLKRYLRRHPQFNDAEQFQVARIPFDAQEFINLCEHRDDKIARLRELEERYGEAHPALVILWKLVAKDDDGAWETIFDAGHKLDPDDAALLERLMGF